MTALPTNPSAEAREARELIAYAKVMERFRNPHDPHNSPRHHSGKPCIVKGCDKPAGTWWSPHWCFAHNVERMDRITDTLEGRR